MVIKKLLSFTLSMTVALSTIFAGGPLKVKAAEDDNSKDCNYIIGVADEHNWTGPVVNGESGAISSKGVLLWPGEKVISNSRQFTDPNTTINCHHGSNTPPANRYSNYVGLNITSADEQVTLDTLGEWVSDEE